ncbi:MAG: hypothetical protein ABFS14_06770 [Gemmatimonadota bacterium]
MKKRTRRVLLAPLAALFLLASAAIPASNDAAAQTACVGAITTSFGSGTLISGYCPISVSCCSLGMFDIGVISCDVCECGYLISGGDGSYYFTRNTQWSCWLF